MFEKILVPLDGSVLAEAALPYAEELAGKLSSEVILLYVSDPVNDPYRHMYDPYLQKMVESVKEGARKDLGKLVDREINVGSRILVGDAAEQITSYAENKDIGLIIMSSHGHTGFKRWTLGNVTDKVIRNTTRPIAIVRSQKASSSRREITRLLVPLDGSKVSEAALPYAEELAARLKAQLVLFQVLTPDYYAYTSGQYKELEATRKSARDYLEKTAAQMQQKEITAVATIREGLVAETAEMVIQMAEETEAAAVIMATHGKSGIGRWALGSVADKVLRGIEAPLILVKPPEMLKS